MDAFRAGVSQGQYRHADGLFYGGRAPAWSNATFRRIIQEESRGAGEVRLIDIHTGLGPFGHGEIMGLGDAPSVARARAIWGDKVTDLGGGAAVSAAVSGDIGLAFFSEAGTAGPAAAIALEFGTRDPAAVLAALRIDNWLHRHAGESHPEADRCRAEMAAAFYPDDAAWQEAVAAQARDAVLRALAA